MLADVGLGSRTLFPRSRHVRVAPRANVRPRVHARLRCAMAPNQESSYKKFLAGFRVLAFGALGMTASALIRLDNPPLPLPPANSPSNSNNPSFLSPPRSPRHALLRLG